jgi:hypothetical protein
MSLELLNSFATFGTYGRVCGQPKEAGSMNSLSQFSQRTSSITMAALLAACGGSPPQAGTALSPADLQQQIPELRQPTDGGAFSAGYSGVENRVGDCFKGDEFLNFFGDGQASFLRRSHELGRVVVRKLAEGCQAEMGGFSLISDEHEGDEIFMSVLWKGGNSWDYKVIGGTGRFANASGSGTWSFDAPALGGAYSDTWTGKLNF